MRSLMFVVFLPAILFALERVNLIKDHSFEQDSEVWKAYAKTRTGADLDSNAVNTHNQERFFQGFYSASCDTRQPAPAVDSAVIIQGFAATKTVSDIDSLILEYSIESYYDDFSNLHTAFIALYLDAGKPTRWFAGYALKAPDLSPAPLPPIKQLGIADFPKDTVWHSLAEAIGADIIASGLSDGLTVDSFILIGWGGFFPPWRGQKLYWDDIRLTGYADYDVGVKEILSGDSVWAGVYYKPVARIKSFGRQAADDFLAIAEIRQGETLVWADTIPYTLPADTEDTLKFDSFPIPNALSCTLTIRTVMEPDESDEDDQLSKPLYGTGIAEPVTHLEPLFLEVLFPSTIQYSVPYAGHVNLSIYDVTGHLVTKLVDDEVPPGVHTLRWEGLDKINRRCASGVYFVRLEADKYTASKKIVLLK